MINDIYRSEKVEGKTKAGRIRAAIWQILTSETFRNCVRAQGSPQKKNILHFWRGLLFPNPQYFNGLANVHSKAWIFAPRETFTQTIQHSSLKAPSFGKVFRIFCNTKKKKKITPPPPPLFRTPVHPLKAFETDIPRWIMLEDFGVFLSWTDHCKNSF